MLDGARAEMKVLNRFDLACSREGFVAIGNGHDVITANLTQPVQVLLKFLDRAHSLAGSAFVVKSCNARGPREVPFPKLRGLGLGAQAQSGFRASPQARELDDISCRSGSYGVNEGAQPRRGRPAVGAQGEVFPVRTSPD